MFREYRFILLSAACACGAVVAHAIGGPYGVVAGYVAALMWGLHHNQLGKGFKTDVERVLESLNSREEMLKETYLYCKIMIFGLLCGLVLVQILPAAIATVMGLLIVLSLATKV